MPKLPFLNQDPATLKSAFINQWQVEPQSDDRPPMFGAVAVNTASQAAGRSISRRRHQAMYKEWSKSRHD